MEEASVAGESPDRSKQHESSVEPTSGSASPVPEARSETTGKGDPRLAVARESGTRSRGGVDTATRTLSVRELAEAAGRPGAARGDAGEGSGRADAGETEGSVQAEAGTTGEAGRADAGSGADAGQADTATAAGTRQADAGRPGDAGQS
ncbi:D-alanyl-D-alanine carboxypeptidase, partial [Streptomyces sp. NPDC050619]